MAIPTDSNIEKLKKYQGIREELEMMWGMSTVIPMVSRALEAVTPELGEWIQQIPGQYLRSLSRGVQS